MSPLLLLLLPLLSPQEPKWSSPGLQVEVDLGIFAGLKRVSSGSGGAYGLQGEWQGKVGDDYIVVEVNAYDGLKPRFRRPEDVCNHQNDELRFAGEDRVFRPEGHRLITGKVGSPAFACVTWGRSRRSEPKASRLVLQLGGLVARGAYGVQISIQPPLADAARDALIEVLGSCVKYTGAVADPRWTDEEARTRWQAVTDPDIHDQLRIVRTEHFIILTNAGGYRLCAKKVEEFYDQIHRRYPFQEVRGRKLLPIFLLRQREEYLDLYTKIPGQTREAAEASAGHAYEDYYATTFEAPNDPVHLHEITHQLFSNRMNLGGGGSWYQEGVAEYMAEPDTQVRAWARRTVPHANHQPLAEFLKQPSLLAAAATPDEGRDRYLQAAALIRYLKESRKLGPRFRTFLYEAGSVPRNDMRSIEAVVNDTYGMSVAQLERGFIKYWKQDERD